MNLQRTLESLARRYPTDSPEADRATIILAKRFTRAQLSAELLRLEEFLREERFRPPTAEQLTSEEPARRQLELVRRARQRTFMPLNKRYLEVIRS